MGRVQRRSPTGGAAYGIPRNLRSVGVTVPTTCPCSVITTASSAAPAAQPYPSSGGAVQFGEYELDVRGGELRKQGIRVQLQEQPFQILKILLERPGQVVTQEELRKKICPSDTFVDFDHGINNAIKRLRVALSDSAEKPRYIETLARHGYRFIASINARQIESVAVLPLDNLSGDPEQEYFAEGLTEALINTLAKIGALRVISRTSVMHYKQAIAKDPAYAAAYAGLADCLTALSAWGLVPASEGCDKARQLAQRAVEMDHSLAEA